MHSKGSDIIKTIKNNKGFTLVEVIVSLLVVGIILAFATSFFFVGQNMFTNSVTTNTSKMIGDNTLKFISDKLTFSGKISVQKNDTVNHTEATYVNVIYINNNLLGFDTASADNTNIYGDNYYNSNRLRISAKVLDDTSLEIKVFVLSKDLSQTVYSTSNVIKAVNMHLTSSKIEADSSLLKNEIINPIISFDDDLTIVKPGTPVDAIIWDETLLSYDGNSYRVKLQKGKYYYYQGHYYMATNNAMLSGKNANGVFPGPGEFTQHLTLVK